MFGRISIKLRLNQGKARLISIIICRWGKDVQDRCTRALTLQQRCEKSDRHTKALEKRCRICAALAEEKDPDKTTYEAELANRYNCLIEKDDKRMHGAKICSKCVSNLNLDKPKSVGANPKNVKKFIDFYRLYDMYHGLDKDPEKCEICKGLKVGYRKRKSLEGHPGQEKRPKYLDTSYENVRSAVHLLSAEERADLFKEMSRSATYKEKINLLSSEEKAMMVTEMHPSFTTDQIVSVINSISSKELGELLKQIKVPEDLCGMIVNMIKSLDGMQKHHFIEKLPQCLADEDCIEFILQLMNSQSSKATENIIDKMPVEEQNSLAFALAKAQYKKISEDIMRNVGGDRRFHDKESVSEWVKKRNSVCKNFVRGIIEGKKVAKKEVNASASKVLELQLAFTIESMYNICNAKYVGPLSFNLAFNIYCYTNSKSAVDLMSKVAPSGSYQHLSRWLNNTDEQKKTSEKCPSGTVMNVFDNEQTIGRKTGTVLDNKTKCSVITTVVHAKISDNGDIQNRKDLKPTPIASLSDYDVQIEEMKKAGTKKSSSIQYIEEKRKKVEDAVHKMIHEPPEWIVIEKYKEIHERELDTAIKKALEQEEEKGSDEIDKRCKHRLRILSASKGVTCVDCNEEYHVRKIVCDSCKSSIGIAKYKKQKTQELEESFNKSKEEVIVIHDSDDEDAEKEESSEKSGQYMHVESNHKGAANLTISQPVLVNPNGYEGIKSVLKHIGISNGIGQYEGSSKEREWTFVACDGAPHVLIQKMMRDYVSCKICREQMTKTEFDDHHAKKHAQVRKAEYFHEFDWIYLIEGMFV